MADSLPIPMRLKRLLPFKPTIWISTFTIRSTRMSRSPRRTAITSWRGIKESVRSSQGYPHYRKEYAHDPSSSSCDYGDGRCVATRV